MEQVIRRCGVERSRRRLVYHTGKIFQVMLQRLIKALANTQILTYITQRSSRWIVSDIDIDACLVGTNRLKRHAPRVFQAIGRTPTNLAIFYPILVHGIPFVTTRDFCHPVAALIIIIGDLFYKAHKLGKVIEVTEERVNLMYRRVHGNRCMMLCQTCSVFHTLFPPFIVTIRVLVPCHPRRLVRK